MLHLHYCGKYMNMSNFKENIIIIEIENSSFCNRQCNYCICYHIDRISKNEIMPPYLFKKIIDELALINYDKIITFHRYNEPFFDKNEMILERISYAKKMLPSATLMTSTNSDYLDEAYVQEIRRAGLDALYCQCHTEEYFNKNIEEIKESMLKINKIIGGFKGKFFVDQNSCVYTTVGSGFKCLTIQAKNFNEVGYPRGGIVEKVKRRKVTGLCYQPKISMTIDYNGSVSMCSNTVSYEKSHEKYIFGNCMVNTVFDIYNCDQAVKLREKITNGDREKICLNCDCNYIKLEQNKKLKFW